NIQGISSAPRRQLIRCSTPHRGTAKTQDYGYRSNPPCDRYVETSLRRPYSGSTSGHKKPLYKFKNLFLYAYSKTRPLLVFISPRVRLTLGWKLHSYSHGILIGHLDTISCLQRFHQSI